MNSITIASHRAISVRVRSNRQVFQTQSPITNVKLRDIYEAFEATSKLAYVQKKDYFASLGMDLDRVEKYLKHVLVLEYLYTLSNICK